MVAFLATDTTGADPSALQITTLKSMAQQYGPAGLRTVIVDTAQSTPDHLVNFGYDWQRATSVSDRTQMVPSPKPRT